MRIPRAPSITRLEDRVASELGVERVAAVGAPPVEHPEGGTRWHGRRPRRGDARAPVARLAALARVCDAGVEWGTAAVLSFTILAFGGVLYWVPYVIVLAAAALAALWCLRVAGTCETDTGLWAVAPAARWGGVLAALIILPLVPLPPALVRFMAPHTYALYRQALPGWPDGTPFAALAANVDVSQPSSPASIELWRPLALVPYDTVATLWTAAAYATVGALVAFYPWRNEAAVTRLLLVLIAVGTFEAVYGMFQQSTPTPSIFGSPCPTSVCMGTYANPDHYAGLLEMILPLALAQAVTRFWEYRRRFVAPARTTNWRPRAARYLEAVYDPAIGRAVSFSCIALLLCVAMAVSGCRSALAATLLSVLLLLRFVPWPQSQPVRLRASALAIVVVAAGFWATFPRLSQKFATHDLDSELHLTGTRALIAQDTLDMVRDSPLVGVGLGNFSTVFPAYRARTVRFSMDIEHAHNDYLEWLAEVGGPATVLTFGLLLWLGVRVTGALRRAGNVTPVAMTRWACAAGVLALLLHSCTDFNLHVPANALVFSVLLGVLLRLTSSAQRRQDRRVSWVGLIAAAVLIVTAFGTTWRRWDVAAATRVLANTPLYAGDTASALQRGDAVHALTAAAERAPGAPLVHDALGQLLATHGTPDSRAAAAREFIRALDAAPLNPRALLHLAGVLDPSGNTVINDTTSARSHTVDLATRAAALASYQPAVQLDIADWYLARWATFDGETRTHAAQQLQALLAATARAPYVMQRRYGILSAYERIQNAEPTGAPAQS